MESIGLILALAGVGLGSAVFVLRPLWQPAPTSSPARPTPFASPSWMDVGLDDAKEAALGALWDVERDYRVGNLAENDYRALRADLEVRAMHILKAEDERERDIDALVEREVARLREGRPALATPLRDAWTRGAPLTALPATVATGHRTNGTAMLPPPTTPSGPGARAVSPAAFWLAGGAALTFALFAGIWWIYLQAPSRVAQQPIATLPTRTVRELAIDPANPNRLFVAHGSGVLGSEDGGRTWRPLGVSGGRVSVAVPTARPETLYAAGSDGVARSDDSGRSWRGLDTSGLAGGDVRALAVDPASPDTLVVEVAGAGLTRSTDGGSTWAVVGSALPNGTMALVMAGRPQSSGVLFAATAQDGVLASIDGGRQWENASGFVNGALPTRTILALAYDANSGDSSQGPAGSNFQGALYAGTDRGLFKSTDGGSSWNRLPLDARVVAVAVSPTDARVVLAADDGGRLFRSNDRGLTWPGGTP